VVATRLTDGWRAIQLEAGRRGRRGDVQVGRVVDGRLELRSVRLGQRAGRAVVEFESAGDADVVCLPAS
jgi:hypothetical protein